MAAYKEIKGINIQKLSADPPAPIEGQVWYNTTSGALKGFKFGSAAWATGGNLNNASGELAGTGTATAGLRFGGSSTPRNATEEYNGTSWTTSGNLGTGRYRLAGAGTQTAALAFGGTIGAPTYTKTTATEEYNGSTWTERSDMIRGRQFLSVAAADNTAALAIGGQNPADATVGLTTLEWNVGLFTKTLSTE